MNGVLGKLKIEVRHDYGCKLLVIVLTHDQKAIDGLQLPLSKCIFHNP